MLAALYLFFLAPDGCRPSAVLKLRFRPGDIKLLLMRDPKDREGYPRLVIPAVPGIHPKISGLEADVGTLEPMSAFAV